MWEKAEKCGVPGQFKCRPEMFYEQNARTVKICGALRAYHFPKKAPPGNAFFAF